MTVDTARTRANASAAPASDDDDDAADDDAAQSDARQGGASGGQQDTGSDDDAAQDVDWQARYQRERRERRRLEREARRSREGQQATGDVEQRATAAERERDELRGELQRERAYNRIVRVAVDAGAIDPDAVATMLLAADEIEFDSDGRPVDVEDAVTGLLRRKAYLKGAPTPKPKPRSGDAGAGRGGGPDEGEPQSDFNAAFRRAAQKSRTGG